MASGLGGTSLAAPQSLSSSFLPATGLSGFAQTNVSQADSNTTPITPMLTPIAANLSHLVQLLRELTKSNRTMADAIAMEGHGCSPADFERSITACVSRCEQAKLPIVKCSTESKSLKDLCRQDFRHAESIQHAIECSPHPYGFAVLLEYMTKNAEQYEKMMNWYALQITNFEDVLSNRKLDSSHCLKDLLLQLKQLDQLLKATKIKVKQFHESLDDLREIILLHQPRLSLFGGSGPQSATQSAAPLRRLEGPSPFSSGVGASVARIDATLTAQHRPLYKSGFGLGGVAASFFDPLNQSTLFRPTNIALQPNLSTALGSYSFSTPTTGASMLFGSGSSVGGGLGQQTSLMPSGSFLAFPQLVQSTGAVKPFGK